MAEAERPGTHMAGVGIRSSKLWNGGTEPREKCLVPHQYLVKKVSVELYKEVRLLVQNEVCMLSGVTKYHRLGSLKTRNLFFQSSGVGRVFVLRSLSGLGVTTILLCPPPMVISWSS